MVILSPPVAHMIYFVILLSPHLVAFFVETTTIVGA